LSGCLKRFLTERGIGRWNSGSLFFFGEKKLRVVYERAAMILTDVLDESAIGADEHEKEGKKRSKPPFSIFSETYGRSCDQWLAP